MSFIPITREEATLRGWNELDVVFVSGDAYIDHPSFGVPLLARLLESRGFRVGILPQPDWRSKEPFMALGRPKLFFAVSAGAMDSMVAHYTPLKKLRHDDAYTPGNRHGARPNRAAIVYTSCCKAAYRDVPVVIGGIEVSLRRFAHYDYWDDRVRRSIIFDAKADLLIYGMGENPLLELAERMRRGEAFREIRNIRGTAHVAPLSFPGEGREGAAVSGTEQSRYVELPSFEEVSADRFRFAEAYRLASGEMNPFNARTIVQRHGDRLLICNPPAFPLSESELDRVYALPFLKAPHPSYRETIPAWDQIRASVTSHRGCSGGCSFCAITHHQGKTVQSRSEQSILDEVRALGRFPWFRGSISDVGGPTANMYGLACGNRAVEESCRRASCLWPNICRHLLTDGRRGEELLRKIRKSPGVKHLAVSSGVRHDLLERQPGYFHELISHHVGGLLKVAPEHSVDTVLAAMHKPGAASFRTFLKRFREESRRLGKRQAVVPYLMSGHPGCTLNDMLEVALFLKSANLKVEQVQDFTPTPGTLATCMYHTGVNPDTGQSIHVPKTDREKRLQKSLLLWHVIEERGHIRKALREIGKESLLPALCDDTSAGMLTQRKGRKK